MSQPAGRGAGQADRDPARDRARARRVAILLNESNPNHPVFWAAAQSGCAALDLVALRVVANTPTQLRRRRRRDRPATIAGRRGAPDAMYLNERAKLQELMQATRLPVAYGWREHVVAGGLLSYGVDLSAIFRQRGDIRGQDSEGRQARGSSGRAADQVRAGDQLKTAKALGITIPNDCCCARTR